MNSWLIRPSPQRISKAAPPLRSVAALHMLLIRFGLEANVPVLNVDGKPEPFSSNLFFQTVSVFHNQAMKLGEREIFRCFATASLRFHKRVVNTLNGLYVMTNIRARKLGTSEWPGGRVIRSPNGGGNIATLFATLQCAAPHLAERSISRRQRVVVIPLCKVQRPVVTQTFEMAFKTHLGVISRSSAAAIEVDVILDLQSKEVLLHACETVLDSGFVILVCGLV